MFDLLYPIIVPVGVFIYENMSSYS